MFQISRDNFSSSMWRLHLQHFDFQEAFSCLWNLSLLSGAALRLLSPFLGHGEGSLLIVQSSCWAFYNHRRLCRISSFAQNTQNTENALKICFSSMRKREAAIGGKCIGGVGLGRAYRVVLRFGSQFLPPTLGQADWVLCLLPYSQGSLSYCLPSSDNNIKDFMTQAPVYWATQGSVNIL